MTKRSVRPKKRRTSVPSRESLQRRVEHLLKLTGLLRGQLETAMHEMTIIMSHQSAALAALQTRRSLARVIRDVEDEMDAAYGRWLALRRPLGEAARLRVGLTSEARVCHERLLVAAAVVRRGR